MISDLAKSKSLGVKCVSSLELIPFESAGAFLDATEERGLTVLGIEGFRLEGDSAVPDIKAIADFSTLLNERDAVADSARAARRFVSQVGRSGMFFEFVLAE